MGDACIGLGFDSLHSSDSQKWENSGVYLYALFCNQGINQYLTQFDPLRASAVLKSFHFRSLLKWNFALCRISSRQNSPCGAVVEKQFPLLNLFAQLHGNSHNPGSIISQGRAGNTIQSCVTSEQFYHIWTIHGSHEQIHAQSGQGRYTTSPPSSLPAYNPFDGGFKTREAHLIRIERAEKTLLM